MIMVGYMEGRAVQIFINFIAIRIIPIIIIFFIHFSNESSHIISYLFDIANGYQRDFQNNI
jgi:hypothetical protein